MNSVLCIYLMLLAIGLNKIFLIPEGCWVGLCVSASVRLSRGGSTAVTAVLPWCYHGSTVGMGVPLRSQGGILENVAILLRCHFVPRAVPAVLLRFLYGNGVSTEIELRFSHGTTAGIFCGRHGAALLPQRQRSSTACPAVAPH